jgi:predicted nucleotidyltransferase
MDCDEVISTLCAHRRELNGSTARDEAGPDSDVDLLAAFDRDRRLSLLDVVGIELSLPSCSAFAQSMRSGT